MKSIRILDLIFVFMAFYIGTLDLLSDDDIEQYGVLTEPIGSIVSTYFNGKVYFFSRRHSDIWTSGVKGDFIKSFKFDIDDNGMLQNFVQNQCQVVTGENTSGTSLCTCIYKGKAYVFYDNITSDKSKRYISYKNNSDPENSPWSPTGGGSVALEGSPFLWNVRFGDDSELPLLTATEFNGRLYLFYTKTGESYVHILSFDGQEWSCGGGSWTDQNNDIKQDYSKYNIIDCRFEIQQISAQTVINDDKKSEIAIAVKVKKENKYKILVFTYDGKLSSNQVGEMNENVYNSNNMQAIFGSDEINGKGKNILWIYTDGNIYYHVFGTKDIILKKKCNNYNQIGTTATAVYVQDRSRNLNSPDLQMYIKYIYLKTEYPFLYLYGMTQKQDYLKYDSNQRFDTTIDLDDKKNRRLWVLVGVIEGVPPFTYNGNPEKAGNISNVNFSNSSQQTVSESSTYYNSVSIGASIFDPTVPVSPSSGFSFQQAFNSTIGSSRTISKTIDYNFFPDELGGYGKCGYLIFEKPIYTFSKYLRCTSSGLTLNDVYLTSLKETFLGKETYILEDPELYDYSHGMTKAPNSQNINAWQKEQHTDGEPLFCDVENLPQLALGSGYQIIEVTSNNTASNVGFSQSQIQLDANVIFASMQGVFSFTQESSHILSTGKSFVISGKLESPPIGCPRYVTEMYIRPILLKPKQKDKKASWVPNLYKGNSPWLLTWKVSGIKYNCDIPKNKNGEDANGDLFDSDEVEKTNLIDNDKVTVVSPPNTIDD